MFEFFVVAVFFWLLVKTIGLAFRLTWGLAKVTASILIMLAFPALIMCLIFVGGFALLIPIVMIAIAAGILRACL